MIAPRNLIVALLLSIGANFGAQTAHLGADPVPQPAIPALLAAFDKYDDVGLSEAHRMKDEDDFILTLIRTPVFCLNSASDEAYLLGR